MMANRSSINCVMIHDMPASIGPVSRPKVTPLIATAAAPLAAPFFAPDSAGVRFAGSWPFGLSYAVALDIPRNLVYLGSGGGVYVLNIQNDFSRRVGFFG